MNVTNGTLSMAYTSSTWHIPRWHNSLPILIQYTTAQDGAISRKAFSACAVDRPALVTHAQKPIRGARVALRMRTRQTV